MTPLPGTNGTQRVVTLADLASPTSTSYIAAIGPLKLPATASVMDLTQAAHRVAARSADMSVECIQTTYAHREAQHLLISEFECTNSGETAQDVIIEQGRCNRLDRVDAYIYDALCPKTNATKDGKLTPCMSSF